MKIKDIMMQNHTSNVYEAARWLNAAETDRMVETYQSAWDNGESFTGVWGNFCTEKRESDTQEEANACAKQLYNALVTTLKREWARSLTHKQAKSVVDALQAARITNIPSITICEGVSLYLEDVHMLWEDTHPDEKIDVVDYI